MLIQSFPSGPFSTNAFVVACSKTREAAIIDPAPDSCELLLNYLAKHKYNCKKILLTHSHWDHIADVFSVKEQINDIKVYVHPLDSPNLEHPGSDGLPCMFLIPKVKPDVLLFDGMEISIGEHLFQVIHTPGHTPGSVCFYCASENMLLSGDTLFKGMIGNLSFPTSQPHLMWDSLAKLEKLPPETKVYSGHGSTTTIGAEKWLPYAKERFS